MFSHVMVGANDIEKSKLFYDKVLGVLGADEGRLFPNLTGQKRYFYFLDGMTKNRKTEGQTDMEVEVVL